MDLDKAFVSAVIAGGKEALREVRDKGVTLDLLVDDGKIAFDHLLAYSAQYSDLPSFAVLQIKSGVSLPVVKEPAIFFADELLKRKLYQELQAGSNEFAQLMTSAKPIEALDHLEKMVRGIRRTSTIASARIESIPKMWAKTLAMYDMIKAGKRGILSPWATLNDETLGFWPEDLVLFVARVGVGKTWCAAVLGYHAWIEGKYVLFGTTELSMERIAQRFCALHYKLNYSDFRKGRLGTFEEKKFREGVQEMLNAEGLYTTGGNFDFRVESYEGAVEDVADRCEPEELLAIIDGAYLLKVEGKTRTERAAHAFDELKRVCKRTKVPNIVTMQFNRDAKAGQASTAAIENIALTDVAAWNTDLAYALSQTEDMKKDRYMAVKPLKVREGSGEEFEVNWDFNMMNFTERPKLAATAANNDPFAAGSSAGGSSKSDADDTDF